MFVVVICHKWIVVVVVVICHKWVVVVVVVICHKWIVVVQVIRIRIRIILFWQHTTYRNSNVYKKDIITYMPTWRLLLRPFLVAIIGPPEK